MKMDEFTDAQVQDFFDNHYVDRGMKKWQGFFLSDHTSALKQKQTEDNEILVREAKKQMAIKNISETINQAIVKNKYVRIQLNEKDINGIFSKEIEGKILGNHEDQIYVGDNGFVRTELIRHIEIMK